MVLRGIATSIHAVPRSGYTHPTLRSFAYIQRRRITSDNAFFRISEEVREAIHSKKPVVALETTIYTHGFPYPENVALASELESIVRVNGGVPATIGIIDGIAKVGLEPTELIKLASSAGSATTLKVSRRDLSYVCGLRLAGKNFNGGTTIAGTMVLAHLAGIKVFATGGLGGVHRGAESSMDISADLTELGRTPVTVISSGCKSFLDISRTLEYLETEGVGVATFADGREGKVDFPAFWSRESGVKSPMTIKDETEAAAIIYAQTSLPLTSGLHFANPIPVEASIARSEMDAIISEAIKQADAAGASGNDNTPFILAKIKELSGGNSVVANRALISSNVKRGTLVAKELASLEKNGIPPSGPPHRDPTVFVSPRPPLSKTDLGNLDHNHASPTENLAKAAVDVIVAGALAVDFSCDYAPLPKSSALVSPQMHTSNPARITPSIGGVAHNVAKAAHLVGCAVQLCSIIGEDLSGKAALGHLKAEGMDTDGVRILDSSAGERTAQYVAVNDAEKNLVMAMADMNILESARADFDSSWNARLTESKPRWLVVDANWKPSSLLAWLRAGKDSGAKTAFEPVSVAKSTRPFLSGLGTSMKTVKDPEYKKLGVYPNHIIDLVTPNSMELTAMYTAARDAGLFDSEEWWRIIDALGISSAGARNRFVQTTSATLVDQGIPQQCVQLLPFMPTILTKFGSQGVLLAMLLEDGDPRLRDADSIPYIISIRRNDDEKSKVGGVYMRLFPPAEVLGPGQLVSVNGAGDTFLGTLIAGLARDDRKPEEIVMLAQQSAVLTLKSSESVSPQLKELHTAISRSIL